MASAEKPSNDSAQSPAWSRNARPPATSPRAVVRLRASPANTNGGSPARRFSTCSTAAASGQSGCCSAGCSRQLDGVHWGASTTTSVAAKPHPRKNDSPLGRFLVMSDFLTDVKTLQARARAEIEKGPITEAYGADRERVIQVLNDALATEIVCWLRYKRHYFTATGLNAEPVAAEFLQHATDEAA